MPCGWGTAAKGEGRRARVLRYDDIQLPGAGVHQPPPSPPLVCQVARLAAGIGKSLQEVVAWNHRTGEYTATALHSRGRGRVSAPGQVRSAHVVACAVSCRRAMVLSAAQAPDSGTQHACIVLQPLPPIGPFCGQESLYDELGSWADPEGLPAQLAAAAAARKRRPTPAQLAEIRRSKQEAKRARQASRLFA